MVTVIVAGVVVVVIVHGAWCVVVEVVCCKQVGEAGVRRETMTHISFISK